MARSDALLIAALFGLALIRALIRGDAAAGEGIPRETEPMAYWLMVLIGVALALGFLYYAWAGHPPRFL